MMQSLDMARVKTGDLRVGDPLPWSVFDARGCLLLRKGMVINSSHHLNRLMSQGLYFSPRNQEAPRRPAAPAPQEEVAKPAVFDLLELCKVRMKRLFQDYLAGKGHVEFVDSVMDVAFNIQEACGQDTDAALASLHLDSHTVYSVVHPIQAALLCELLGRKKGISEMGRLPLVCAALTHNIGILPIQDALDNQTTPLTDEQRRAIRVHPELGGQILQKLGVYDMVWLDAVVHHHERLDGSGYPKGLKEGDISCPARIMAITDVYCAMTRVRPYRPQAIHSRDALKDLFLQKGATVDASLTQMLIKEIGVFPPGTLVRLKNNEIAVVKQRQENSACPILYTVLDAAGMPLSTPLRRDCTDERYAITTIVSLSQCRSVGPLIRQLWRAK